MPVADKRDIYFRGVEQAGFVAVKLADTYNLLAEGRAPGGAFRARSVRSNSWAVVARVRGGRTNHNTLTCTRCRATAVLLCGALFPIVPPLNPALRERPPELYEQSPQNKGYMIAFSDIRMLFCLFPCSDASTTHHWTLLKS